MYCYDCPAVMSWCVPTGATYETGREGGRVAGDVAGRAGLGVGEALEDAKRGYEMVSSLD
jgi:hypothetical protein